MIKFCNKFVLLKSIQTVISAFLCVKLNKQGKFSHCSQIHLQRYLDDKARTAGYKGSRFLVIMHVYLYLMPTGMISAHPGKGAESITEEVSSIGQNLLHATIV